MTDRKINWKFDNTYSKLSDSLLTKIKPLPVKNPKLVLFNHSLSDELDLDFKNIKEKEIADIFSGNKLPEGTETFAQAYAGHQFGHFTILGDGRALVIGEHINKKKEKGMIFNSKVLAKHPIRGMLMVEQLLDQC